MAIWLSGYLAMVVVESRFAGDIKVEGNQYFDSEQYRRAIRLQPSTTSLVIQARDRLPIRTYIGMNNTGTESTKEERVAAGLNWGNAFGLGRQMNLQLIGNPHFEHSRSLSGS